MRLPITYILSASVAGITLLVGAYVIWESFLSHRMVLNKFPDLTSPTVERDLASVPEHEVVEAVDGTGFFSMDEVVVNINEKKTLKNHMIRIKLELELFDADSSGLLEQRLGGLKHTLLEAAREQDFHRLNTLDGKLYFKEELISRMNEFLETAAIRQIHFTTFFLQ